MMNGFIKAGTTDLRLEEIQMVEVDEDGESVVHFVDGSTVDFNSEDTRGLVAALEA